MSELRTYPSRRSDRRRERGITALELLIALAVIGLLTVLAVSGLRYFRSTDLRGETNELSAVLRAAYNMAATTSVHHRVVFDLDQQRYRIEMCEGDIKLTRGDKDKRPEVGEADEIEDAKRRVQSQVPPEVLNALSPEDAAKAADALSGSRLGAAQCKPPELPTGDSDQRGAERQLDGGVKIKRMFVQHLEGELTDGIVHINFFPLGYAEKAYIELEDSDGDRFTLLVHGLTGRIELRQGGNIKPEDHMLRRADGEEIEER